MKKIRYETADAYIAAQAPESRAILKKIQSLIASTLPDAEESILWGAPFYKLYGLLAEYAAFKTYVRFSLIGSELDENVRSKLQKKGYAVLKRSFRIRFDQKVPAAEIRQILKAKAEFNRERLEMKYKKEKNISQ